MTARKISELRLEGVSRGFGGRLALDGLDVTIKGGEFVALLGPSGCGKSTALNCVAGLLPLTAGRIWLDDARIDTLPPEKRGFGMVFQNYALFPHMTVRANIGFGLRMRKTPAAEMRTRVDEALRLVQLADLADRLPGQLSGGQQQRVAIARAVVLEPPLVLMDEPLSNLDAALRLEMRTEIRRLHQTLGLTTIYVTHDQEEALSLADRLVVLRDGVLQQAGTPEQVYTEPANRFVASFMGYRNALELPVTGGEGRMVRLEDGGGLTLTGVRRGEVGGAGATAVACVRPEDFTVGDGPNPVAAAVEVVEYHGRESAALVRADGGVALHVRTSARLAPGDRVTLSVPPERVLVFAP
ncbi:putative spermidine/putrescine transport system ATP-binding protein [Thermocatellispora tengchongensis]|uniref:Putative spermidine/putrescine transport system ATP-binding protein n=1 Tax=Thermocatellispora tengchongensis TaxID=1073253 RepID=A0A840PMV9_9ACTN|nr:ABC transporter ATP-binding protein [Thermocatellispora tengchongensis]MBB5139121.1 putative spermidine/putrescine transport system ATP-binding protein [Thermocatellispora tengchongensis]